MKTQSELKLFKSGEYKYIYIYYKLEGKTLRINTKNIYNKNLVKKDLYYNSIKPNFKELNYRTSELKRRVDEYIRLKLEEPFPEVDQKECKEYIDDKHYIKVDYYPSGYIRIADQIKQPKQEKTVVDLLEDFLQEKKQELNYNYHSYKKYITLKNGIINYEKSSGKKLSLDTMNSKKFIYDFRDHLLLRGYNDNAANMRVKNLKTFFRYLESNSIFNFNHVVFDTKLSTYENDVVTLSRNDIKQLLNLEIGKKEWQKIIDVFVCNCFMGLRHGDLYTLENGRFKQNDEGNWLYYKENQKTDIDIEIPIVEPALTILKKYSFKLPKYTNQYFNRQLKIILKEYKLFPEYIRKRRKVNTKDISTLVMKRDLITSHTCRKTFVTLALEAEIPLNNIMKATGHIKLSTLDYYVEKKQDYDKFQGLAM